LEAQKKLSIEIDLSKDVVFPIIKMIQHDTNILEFVVKENGEDADLSKIGRIIVYYRRPDKEEIPRFLKANGNKINYVIGYQEMKLFGEGQMELQFYSLDNLSRVSTKRFKIYLSGSSGTDLVIESDKDLTVLQELFEEVSDLKTLAAQSTDIVNSEAERIENEEFRSANEDTRIANESNRVSAEALRNSAEVTRNTQEDAREQAEFIREENEDIRLENENDRQSAESTRSQIEAIRQTKETERLTNESGRVSAENTRQSNESNRQSNEAIRSNNEAERISDENVRKSAETSRINAETVRVDNENVRQQQESDRQVTIQQAVSATQNAYVAANEARTAANDVTINSEYAKQQAMRAEKVADENKTIWLSPVANFAAIATTYPNALDGSQVLVTDDSPGIQNQYRKINGSWVWTGRYRDNALVDLQARFNDANMQIQTLSNGTSILTSALNSPVLIEVQGRTLTSLGNSNLEGNKNYVLADKRTKIRAEGREGSLINGVAKFTKSASLISKADFVGKVAGSVVENAHIVKYAISPTLQAPSAFTSEISTLGYGRINTLNGTVEPLSNSGNGNIVQMLFSKNIIEHIERKHGRIPSDTVSGKVQWIKDNVQRLTANWHGWGSSVGGNKANVAQWHVGNNAWDTILSHTNSTVTKIARSNSSTMANAIDNNGLSHFLAFAEPSDGTTPSQLNTDFVELEVELKASAVLDTRPIITRVATFEGKVAASTVENPHKTGYLYQITLQPPSAFGESSQPVYGEISTLNGISNSGNSVPNNGYMSQRLFSYNLIEEVERNIGRISKATVAEKRQWIVENGDRIALVWNGFGSSVGGNKATLYIWNGSTWVTIMSHTNSTVSPLTSNTANINNYLQNDGVVHYLVAAESSDGNVASTINTDFIQCEISLKQGATLHDPILPLFEVDATDYANILVSWNENEVMARYPKVMGSQHLQNLAVIAEGENLLPPFSEWTVNSLAQVSSPYELKIPANAGGNVPNQLVVQVVPNKDYILTLVNNGGRSSVTGNTTGTSILAPSGSASRTFNSGNNTSITVLLDKASGTSTEVVFSNPMLTLGSTVKPFVPRNPSYLFAPVKLGQIGDKKDSLFKSDGQWTMVERLKKDVALDGSLDWRYSTDFPGYKTVYTITHVHPNGNSNTQAVVTKYNGSLLSKDTVSGASFLTNYDKYILATTSTIISIADVDSGWGETYAANNDEIKAYFNGWQAKTTDGNGKPTAWRSLGDGTDAPTQTLAYVKDNKAPNFTPYKLSYVLANPQTTNVNHLVEGDIAVSGSTVEVTSGVVVREKVVPVLQSGEYRINLLANSTSWLKNKVFKIFEIYKNGYKDNKWFKINSLAYGNERLYIPQADFDTTATYEVTYLVLDRHLQTANATEVKASYSGSIKDSLDMQVEKVSDLATQQSVMANQMYRVLVALKAANITV
jgi:hypothetical protein